MSQAKLRSAILKPFCPSEYVSSIFEIDYDSLKKEGKTNILFDLDNTLVARDSNLVTDKLSELFQELTSSGFKIAIVSNNWGDRVDGFGRDAGVPVLGKAVKPFRRAYRKGMKLIGAEKKATVAIGDQLFTDIFGANLFGLKSILVSPISQVDLAHTRLLRHLERFILSQLTSLGRLKNLNGDIK